MNRVSDKLHFAHVNKTIHHHQSKCHHKFITAKLKTTAGGVQKLLLIFSGNSAISVKGNGLTRIKMYVERKGFFKR